MTLKGILLASIASIAAPIAPALAQTTVATQTPAAAEADQNSTALADIVVTAQKRSESIERVPASIQVQSGETIAIRQQTSLRAIAVDIPNLVLTAAPSGSIQANIRGFGTSTGNAGFEQTVALYVDGVYEPRPQLYTGAVFDIDRIEVVKGTQGALFGKNASVGAISLITRAPEARFGGYVNMAYNFRFDQKRVEAAVNLPVADRVRLRIAGVYDDADKGWVRNLALGGKQVPTSTEYGVRAKAEVDVTGNLTLNGKIEYAHFRRNGDALLGVGGAVFPGITVDDAVKSVRSTLIPTRDGQPTAFRRSDVESLGGVWEVGGLTVTAISAWQRLRFGTYVDADNTAGPRDNVNHFTERFSQFTQEIRVATPADRPVAVTAGGFYLRQRLDVGVDQLATTSVSRNLLSQKVADYSAFAQLMLQPIDKVTVTLGGRYTHERKIGTLAVSKPTASAVTPGRAIDDSFDWSGTAEYELAANTRVYATISRGSKAPGFLNSVAGAGAVPAQLIFPAERSTNYEIGLKSRFLDGRARASIAVYQLDVDNFQAAQFVQALNGFAAASRDARARGVEGQVQFRALRDLTLNGSFAYNDANFRDTDTQLVSAPRWNLTGGFDFTPTLTDAIDLDSGVTYNYVTKYPHQFDLLRGNFTPSHPNLDARIGVKFSASNIRLSVIGKNLTNERYADFALGYPYDVAGAAFTQQLNQPRSITLSAQVPF